MIHTVTQLFPVIRESYSMMVSGFIGNPDVSGEIGKVVYKVIPVKSDHGHKVTSFISAVLPHQHFKLRYMFCHLADSKYVLTDICGGSMDYRNMSSKSWHSYKGDKLGLIDKAADTDTYFHFMREYHRIREAVKRMRRQDGGINMDFSVLGSYAIEDESIIDCGTREITQYSQTVKQSLDTMGSIGLIIM